MNLKTKFCAVVLNSKMDFLFGCTLILKPVTVILLS
jgi:hypothetical protein